MCLTLYAWSHLQASHLTELKLNVSFFDRIAAGELEMDSNFGYLIIIKLN